VDGGGTTSLAVAQVVDDGGVYVVGGSQGLAVDPAGKLWVSNIGSQLLARIDPNVPAGISFVATEAILTDLDGGAPFIANVDNVTFDASGNMWLIDSNPSLVRVDNPASYVGTVQPVPAAVFTNAPITDVGKLQFNLPNPALGLF
jgi:streptogramin lyase